MEDMILISWIQFGILIFILIFLTLSMVLFLHRIITPIGKTVRSLKVKIAKEIKKKKIKLEKKENE